MDFKNQLLFSWVLYTSCAAISIVRSFNGNFLRLCCDVSTQGMPSKCKCRRNALLKLEGELGDKMPNVVIRSLRFGEERTGYEVASF